MVLRNEKKISRYSIILAGSTAELESTFRVPQKVITTRCLAEAHFCVKQMRVHRNWKVEIAAVKAALFSSELRAIFGTAQRFRLHVWTLHVQGPGIRPVVGCHDDLIDGVRW
jgi:hypothetical protein